MLGIGEGQTAGDIGHEGTDGIAQAQAGRAKKVSLGAVVAGRRAAGKHLDDGALLVKTRPGQIALDTHDKIGRHLVIIADGAADQPAIAMNLRAGVADRLVLPVILAIAAGKTDVDAGKRHLRHADSGSHGRNRARGKVCSNRSGKTGNGREDRERNFIHQNSPKHAVNIHCLILESRLTQR